jgi:hypothetical protein
MQEYNKVIWMLTYKTKKGKNVYMYFDYRLDAFEYIENKNLKNYQLICKDTSFWD